MKIDLNKIPEVGLDLDDDITISNELYKNTDILDLKNLHILGNINYDYEKNLIINLKVEGIFVLEDAVTLDNIDYPFCFDMEEKIENIKEYCGEFYEKSKNTLDISEILWENIVLEIPISATKADIKNISMNGNGWELKNDNVKKIDPRLAKLAELFGEGEE